MSVQWNGIHRNPTFNKIERSHKGDIRSLRAVELDKPLIGQGVRAVQNSSEQCGFFCFAVLTAIGEWQKRCTLNRWINDGKDTGSYIETVREQRINCLTGREEAAMNLMEAMRMLEMRKETENGALAYSTSGSALLDLFAMGGAMRSRRASEIGVLFLRAFWEDSELAMKLLFYIRDIRGGLGERRTGRILLETAGWFHPRELSGLLPLIAEYGRWDDCLVLLDTPLETEVTLLMKDQLAKDCAAMMKGEPVSMLAKWLPGINTSSAEQRAFAKRLAKAFGMRQRQYRKVLSQLRAYSSVAERHLTLGTPECIRYGQVPSGAMRRYGSAFERRDRERFGEYMKQLESGREKIHAGTLFPYELVRTYIYGGQVNEAVMEAQWKALPDYTNEAKRFLVMADVSGSMHGQPMAASVGLALYFAERCSGPFHNHFLTFSKRPQLAEVKGDTLREKVVSALGADWGMNTDLEAAFLLVLNSAVRFHLPQTEMPESILVITDMEIDRCTKDDGAFLEGMKEQFAKEGYTLPSLVFWNVSARHSTFHASAEEAGVRLVSGFSTRIFTDLAQGIYLTPYEHMKKTLMSERYAKVTLRSEKRSG